MRHLGLRIIAGFFILFFCLTSLRAQEIAVYGQRSLWHADNLCDIEFTGCDWRTLNKGYLLGYAYHPNGSLWLVLFEQFPSGYHRINIFDVKINPCKYTLLYSIPLPKFWGCAAAVNIDFMGRLYLNVAEYDTISNKSTGTLSRIADPSNPVIERVFLTYPQQRFFEVHFARDRIYMVEIDKPYIRVFDNNFVLLDTIIMQKHIWGLTSFSYGCDSVKTYAAHMNMSTAELINSPNPDTTMYISEYDFETNTLTPVCNYWMGNNRANTQLTSPLEFLSSDPECDLLIDLDRDNSTGVYPYDYLDSSTYCATVETTICDEDIYIHTSAPLDSISLVLSNILDAGAERLTMLLPPTGINYISRDDSTYVIIGPGGSDNLYRQAVLALRYQHNGQNRTPGSRHVILQGFNSIKEGVKITATLHIAGLPYAGEDAILLICSDTLIEHLSDLTAGQTSGYWSPALASGGDRFNAAKDVLNQYRYIVMDPACGRDTATITIIRDATAPSDILGEDQRICAGDSLSLFAGYGAADILWDDGSRASSRNVTNPGLYWISVTTSGGCVYRDSIGIFPGALWIPEIITIDPTCGLDNGKIAIDSLDIPAGSKLLVNNNQLSKPYIDLLPAKFYRVTTVSNDGCTSDRWIDLFNVPALSIDMDTILFVPQDEWKSMDYKELNGVAVADIQFTPTSSIRWTGSTIEVFGNEDRQYSITFIDDHGCTDTHFLRVRVEKAKGIYTPNVFSPTSNNANAIWYTTIDPSYALEMLLIYDRWGNAVHHSVRDATWDGTFHGKLCPSGVYVYQLVVVHLISHERKVLTGNVTLLR
ncbi:MAG: T9SS type B sorting domain-containing protein [Saprospiraceae bacterium]